MIRMKPRAIVAVILIEGKINLHMNFPSNHLQDHTLVNSAIKVNNEKTKSERAKAPINCWDTVDVLHRFLVTAITREFPITPTIEIDVIIIPLVFEVHTTVTGAGLLIFCLTLQYSTTTG